MGTKDESKQRARRSKEKTITTSSRAIEKTSEARKGKLKDGFSESFPNILVRFDEKTS